MQYVSIKKSKSKENGIEVYLVPVLNLKDSKGSTKQRIAHPLGDDYLEFETLEDAIKAVELSGFKYVLPDGTRQEIPDKKTSKQATSQSYEDTIRAALLNLTNDINTTVAASAITALAELDDSSLLDLFIEKMGEDSEAVRSAAINSALNFGNFGVRKLIHSLKDENWVRRNSVLICISRLIDSESVNPEKLFASLIEMTGDKNTIVRTSAITALGKAYKLYRKES